MGLRRMLVSLVRVPLGSLVIALGVVLGGRVMGLGGILVMLGRLLVRFIYHDALSWMAATRRSRGYDSHDPITNDCSTV